VKSSSAERNSTEVEIVFESSGDARVVRIISASTARQAPPVDPMTEAELRSIAFADADGWRCFYPATRGHLTAAEARAVMRKERGLPLETEAEAREAEFLLTVENGWGGAESPA